jgi:hypothetical protein
MCTRFNGKGDDTPSVFLYFGGQKSPQVVVLAGIFVFFQLVFIHTLCRFASKSYLENILWTFNFFCAESAKNIERPNIFFDAQF